MENNLQNEPKKLNILSLISLCMAAVSLILSVLGSTLTCACSAKKSMDMTRVSDDTYVMSAVMVLALIGAFAGLAAAVLAVIVLMKDRKDILAILALAVGVFSFIYGILPVLTICCYNCSLNGASKNFMNG